MPHFKYKATENGLRSSGELEAADQQSAIQTLALRGLVVYSFTEIKTPSLEKIKQPTSWGSVRPIKAEEILQCIQELATMLNAGIPLADALLNTSKGYDTKPMGQALINAYNSLRAGKTLAAALNDSGLELPEYVHELVAAGETTGQLGPALTSAATQLDSDARFRRETRNALTYPLVLVISGLIATLVVFIFVVPKFANILSNPKADIPAMSRWVLHSGLWLVQNKILALSLFTAAATSLWVLFSKAGVRQQMWAWASTVPLCSQWITHIELARWAGMFAVLLQHHVPIIDALQHSRNSLTIDAWRKKADYILRDVKTGQSLAAAMHRHHFIDSTGINLIRVGEQSGRLAQTTGSLALMHRTHAEQSMKQFLILLEPITIMFVSVILGGIMISVMLAITSLTNMI
jgi:general secretion pathway protein F